MGSLLLISAPGAGKGVVSKYLKEKYNYMHISMGNLLRELAKSDSTINQILKEGGFVDNTIVYNLLEDVIRNNKNTNFVFEGFPRTLTQNKNFEKILSKYDIILDRVIYVDIKKKLQKKELQVDLCALDAMKFIINILIILMIINVNLVVVI